ncbi:hypothetical protein [Micromonospora sp. CA-248212]|uniref:hypothetical protein n=1 Tax=Micromonospora sp. CA-248212 TaxID=3239961 RepID=UPI003D94C234
MHCHRLLTLLCGAAPLAGVIGPGLRWWGLCRPVDVVHGGTVELVGQPCLVSRSGTGLRVDMDSAFGEPHDDDPLGGLGARVDARPLGAGPPGPRDVLGRCLPPPRRRGCWPPHGYAGLLGRAHLSADATGLSLAGASGAL